MSVIRDRDFSVVVSAASSGEGVGVMVRHTPTGIERAIDPVPRATSVGSATAALKAAILRDLYDPADYKVELACGEGGTQTRVVNVRTGRATAWTKSSGEAATDLLDELITAERRSSTRAGTAAKKPAR